MPCSRMSRFLAMMVDGASPIQCRLSRTAALARTAAVGAKQTVRITHQTTPRPTGRQNALYCRFRPQLNSMTVWETERKYGARTVSGEKSGGNNTAKPTLPPPVVSGHSHSIVLKHQNALIHRGKSFRWRRRTVSRIRQKFSLLNSKENFGDP
jgi:hypothetical protein